jgi:hypothetical protein
VVRELADCDHEQEDAAGREHREDDLRAVGRGIAEERMENRGDHGEKLSHAPLGMRRECGVDGLVAGGRAGGRVERSRI